MLRFVLMLGAAASLAPGTCFPLEGERVPEIFDRVIGASGSEYVEARREILSKGDEIRPFLRGVLETSDDWRELVAAKALQGWLDDPRFCKALWNWKPQPSPHRNPFPSLYAEAMARFSSEGDKAIPVMLELVWKKGELHYGVLPTLLATWNIELSIPVLAEHGAGLHRLHRFSIQFYKAAYAAAQAALLVHQVAEHFAHVRDRHHAGLRGRRGAPVGDQVGDRDIHLVPDGADDRDAGLVDGPRDNLLVEGPEVFERATPASDDQQVELESAVSQVDVANGRGKRIEILEHLGPHLHFAFLPKLNRRPAANLAL